MLKTVQLLRSLVLVLITTVAQGTHFLRLALSSRAALSAEVLFLRKQLAFYQEHRIPPRKLTAAARFSLVLWSRFFPWRDALMIVKPETLIGWHRKGFRESLSNLSLLGVVGMRDGTASRFPQSSLRSC